jgi:tRNA A-37 threonylcarbamoyl transferase component Bud32
VIGETIGHFQIVARAGRGGMGEVFIAEHAAIKTRVAIKVLHAHVSASSGHLQRFFNEARAVARVHHAGIVKIFDVGVHAERAYLIMEYLQGETLGTRLRRAGPTSPRAAAEIARQIASILDATHHAGIIHRDLKPENVFLVADRELAGGERVKLLDFGIAKLSDTLAGSSPKTIGTIGTPAYMAPEQWNDSSTVDWRADAYSLGCILYQMMAGVPPFASSSIAEACKKHLHETPSPVRIHAPNIPEPFEALTLRLLAKDPAERATSMAELEDQLAEIAASAPATSAARSAETRTIDPSGMTLGSPADDVPALAAPAGPAARSAETRTMNPSVTTLSAAAVPAAGVRSRHRVTAAIAGAAAIAIAGVAAWRFMTGDRPPPAPAAPPRPPDVAAPAAISAPAPAVREPEPLVAWLEAANPFVAWHGAHWLAHQVTRREYRRFLEALPASEALRLQPVTGWDDRDPMRPVSWVTCERAAAFCQAIHAGLPTSEQWLAASEGAWGLDPGGVGRPGPLQEWTSTVRDGLVIVRGGHDRMSPDQQAAAARDPLMKASEAGAGASPPPNIVASETIGFRCVR